MPNEPIVEKKQEFWQVQPGPQSALVSCPVEDICFGGSRGGGKTVGLLLDWAKHAALYGKKAHGAIFRKRFSPDLQDVIRKGQILLVDQLGWRYNATSHRFTSQSGAILNCFYIENTADASIYKGHEWTWLGIDEIGDFGDPAPLDLLWACLRSADGVPCVRRSSANPGGIGHGWVKRRYIQAGPYKVHKYQPQPEEAPNLWINSVFIPSLLDDNKALIENDPNYEIRLAASGTKALYKAWRFGDWDIVAGQYFDNFDPAIHVLRLSDANLQPWMPRWVSADWGYSDDCAVLWHALDENKRVITYRELVANKLEPIEIGRLIAKNCPEHEKITRFYLGPDAWAKKTSVRTIADEIGAVLRDANLPSPVRADTDRIGGWMLMYQMLSTGHWKITQNCSILIESLPLLQRDEKKVEDIAESSVDHAPDAARYGLKTHLGRSETPIEELVKGAMTAVDDQGNPEHTIRMMQASAARVKFKKARSGPILRGWRRHKTGWTRNAS